MLIRNIRWLWAIAPSICEGSGFIIATRRARFLVKALTNYGLLKPIINARPDGALGKAIKARPEIIGAVIWPYQCSAWVVQTRLSRIRAHYDAVEATGSLLDLPENASLSLLDLSAIKQGLRVAIDQPRWLMREGPLAINLFMEETRIYSLAFSLLQEANGQFVAVVGGLQGRGHAFDGFWRNPTYSIAKDDPDYQIYWDGHLTEEEIRGVRYVREHYKYTITLEQIAWLRREAAGVRDEYRRLTKAGHGMRPRDLLFEVFRMFCAGIGVSEIVAVTNEFRHDRHSYFGKSPKTLSADYNEIWAERGGTRTNAMFYRFYPYRKQRDCTEIRVSKRAMYRRRYQMLNSLNEQLNNNLLVLYKIKKGEAIGKLVESQNCSG
jgi:uncharacterized protein